MKDSRNPNNWSNRELEQDTAGYLAAQQAYRQDQAVAADRRQEEQDLERFTASFTKAGGSKVDAAAAYRAKRNEEATAAAAHADEAARERHRAASHAAF